MNTLIPSPINPFTPRPKNFGYDFDKIPQNISIFFEILSSSRTKFLGLM
ncbi:MAG: hypothetical protein WCW87_00885 [Candidatus Paceibacterota bacterium]